MNWSERQALRARRREIKAELARRKAAARAALAKKRQALGGGKKRKERHRRRLVALLLLILLLALLPDCRCSAPEPPPRSAAQPTEGAAAEDALPPAMLGGEIRRQDRPEYASVAPAPLPWLDAFRMQVAARSPRLATCFVGVSQPGTLKWTTSVEPVTGQVSEHALEPTLLSEPLARRQKACIIEVLSDPSYQLPANGERSTPSRVGLVLEF